MKLWQKQKEGKKKLKLLGRVKITSEIFKELLKK
jgi:translation elongation factor EF-4